MAISKYVYDVYIYICTVSINDIYKKMVVYNSLYMQDVYYTYIYIYTHNGMNTTVGNSWRDPE